MIFSNFFSSDLPSVTSAPSEVEDPSDLEEEDDDETFLPDGETILGGSSPLSVRLYQPKPRAPVQRRATIPGATARDLLSFDQVI